MRPEDDYPHRVGPEPNFNESMYFHFHDPRAGIGGFVRLANRPNETRGERTVCLYLPDGRLGFTYARPAGTSNETFDAAGLRFEIREPLRHIDVSFQGRLFVLDDPAMLADPKRTFATSPQQDCTLDLSVRGIAEASEHSFDTGKVDFAPNHYEQLVSMEGTIRIGEHYTNVRGHGLRDHSWGPRSWQAPWFYRWIHGSSSDFGFMGAWFGNPDGSVIRGGFVWDGGRLHALESVDISTVRDERDEQAIVSAVSTGAGRDGGSTVGSSPKPPCVTGKTTGRAAHCSPESWRD